MWLGVLENKGKKPREKPLVSIPWLSIIIFSNMIIAFFKNIVKIKNTIV
ncbi:MAG: hypothetical protein WC516_01015 [Patescibacteria group bacterium]